MGSLFNYVEKNHRKACCVFNEFQEIATLPESKRIEGTLRSHIQMHKSISFIYVGNRWTNRIVDPTWIRINANFSEPIQIRPVTDCRYYRWRYELHGRQY